MNDIWDEEEDIQLDFHIENFFLLGSPVALFKSLMGKEFYIRDLLPTCDNFFNVYHPADLIAYRIEPIIKYIND